MKIKLILVLVFEVLILNFVVGQTDSLVNKAAVNGLVLVTNNAFAPIPAFSFDKPAIMTFLTISQERFSYEPDFSIGLNGKPWMWNNWFRYALVDKKKLIVGLGINPTLFFKTDQSATYEKITSTHRNLTQELRSKYMFSKKIWISLTYRFNKAFDGGTLDGHFIDFTSEFSQIPLFKKISVNIRPQIFYFNNEDTYNGFYVATLVSVRHEKAPLLLGYQAVQSAWTNYLLKPKYQSNISVIYLF